MERHFNVSVNRKKVVETKAMKQFDIDAKNARDKEIKKLGG